RKTPTKGALKETLPKNMRRPLWTIEPPVLPSLDPTPSIAAFPLSFDSELRGIKEISFVASKRVYLHAREKTFWTVPKKTPRAIGVNPRAALQETRVG